MIQKIGGQLSSVDGEESTQPDESEQSENIEGRPHQERSEKEKDQTIPHATPMEVSPASSATTSYLPVDPPTTRKRVQWASKNRVEHFEHVSPEEESDEESCNVEEGMDKLDEYGTHSETLARLHILEAYLLRSRLQLKADDLQLPKKISQRKKASRSKNIKRMLSYRRSTAISNLSQLEIRSAVSTERSRAGSSSSWDSDFGREAQLYFQELRKQPVERYFDLDHSQFSPVPDIEPDLTLLSSSGAHEWYQKTETPHPNRQESDTVVDDTMIEERGEQERKRWENHAKRLVRAYSTSQRQLPRMSVSSTDSAGLAPGVQQGLERVQRTALSPLEGTDIEAGQSPLNESLPLGGQRGVLGTLLTLYRNPDLSKTSSSLGSTCDQSTTTNVRSVSLSTEDDLPANQDADVTTESAKTGSLKKPTRGRCITDLPHTHFYPSPEESPSSEPAQGEISEPLHGPSSRLKEPFSGSGSILHLPLPTPISRPHILTSPPHLSPGVSSIPDRSSGGVLAALIATSHNLMAPAAPFSNKIAPDLTKKGYALSRYELFSKARLPIIPNVNQDSGFRIAQEQRPVGLVGDRERRATSTTDTSLVSSKAEHDRSEHSERPSLENAEHSLLGWLPNVLSLPSSRASSVFGDKEKVDSTDSYLSNQLSLSRTDEEVLLKRRIQKRKSGEKEKRKILQIYITKHIAEVFQRQEFIMKFARAHLMFAGPSHRLQRQLQAAARVLDLQVSTVHLPNVVLISFGDESTSTSMVKVIQQSSALDLEKLGVMHELFWKVIHDEISVCSASVALDLLMHSPPRYRTWEIVLAGGLCSSAICTLSFSGSFGDSLIVFPLGCILVAVQMISSKQELYSNVFEISVAILLSFLSAALASSGKFCYAALASSSVVLILPGFIVLSGSLELASKQVVSGAVRTCFAVIYSLFLGFGIAIGEQVFARIMHRQVIGPDDFLCRTAHQPTDPWWQQRPSLWWAFLTVPLYSFALSLRNHAPVLKKETLFTILISCGGWTANHLAGVAFHGRPDLQSAVGAFAVGVIANIYARLFHGNAYVVMITGILFQVPSGLANGGLLTFAERDNNTQNGDFTSFMTGFQVAIQLITVAVGLTVGLFASVVVVHPLGGSRKGANVVFSL